MAKSLPLVRRLTLELNATSSEDEENVVYARLVGVAAQASTTEFDAFYKGVVPQQIHSYGGEGFVPSDDDIRRGKDLAKFLYAAIPPLLPNVTKRGQNKRIVAKKSYTALVTEFRLLREYFGEKEDDRNTS